MNGTTTTTDSSTNNNNSGGACCSFYLNLIVLDHIAINNTTATETSTSASDSTLLPESEQTTQECRGGNDDDGNDASGNDDGHHQQQQQQNETEYDESSSDEKKDQSPIDPRTFASQLVVRSLSQSSNGASKKNLLKSRGGIPHPLGGKAKRAWHGIVDQSSLRMHGISQRSSQVANKAGAYAQRKTMVHRAHHALRKVLPELSALYDDLQLGTRFSQGQVTVLHVVLKPSSAALSRYLCDVKDAAAAQQYATAMTTLRELGATETAQCLEREMLQQVRIGLMDKLSTLLLQKMNEREGGLELDCIALEETEEARWLFTFMEFQAQMKS